jgi:hypothetical protein
VAGSPQFGQDPLLRLLGSDGFHQQAPIRSEASPDALIELDKTPLIPDLARSRDFARVAQFVASHATRSVFAVDPWRRQMAAPSGPSAAPTVKDPA